MRKVVGLMFALSFALALPCARAANTEVLRSLVNKGNALMRARHFPEAIAAYQEALKLDPGNAVAKSNIAEAHNNWGIFYCNQKKYGEAQAEWNKCLELAPNHANAKRNLVILNEMCEREGININAMGGPQDFIDPNLPANMEKNYPHATLTNSPPAQTAPPAKEKVPPGTVPPKMAPLEATVGATVLNGDSPPRSSSPAEDSFSVSSPSGTTTPPPSGPSLMAPSGPAIISSPSGSSSISSPPSGPSLIPATGTSSPTPQYVSPPPAMPAAGIPMVTPAVPPAPPSQWTPAASFSNSGPQIVSPIPDAGGPFLRKQSNPLFPATPDQFHGIFAPSQSAPPGMVPAETTSGGGPSLDDQLTQVELKVYGKKQSDMTVLQRLEKIEKETVGQAHGGTIVERINFLKQSFGIN